MAGLARAGQAAARALAGRAGAGAVAVWDSSDSARTRAGAAQLGEIGIECLLGGDGTGLLEGAGSLIKSPGVPPDAPVVAQAVARGLLVIDELELGWRLDSRPTVGITGTNGKSTVCELVRAVLERDGRRPAVAGNTVFGPPLSGLAPEAADVVVAEVSSYQLEACPDFLPDVAVVTNLSLDHLERHPDARSYGEVKRRIALREQAAVAGLAVGVDDAFGRALADECRDRGCAVTAFGRSPESDLRLAGLRWDLAGARLDVRTGRERLELETRLAGEHNALNALAALATADLAGVPRRATLEALAEASAPPGRLEAIDEGQPFPVLVDYAHNPEGIRACLDTARRLLEEPEGRVRVVGCALRVLTKDQRRAMGRAAAEGADDLVLSLDRVSPDEPGGELPPGLEEGAREGGGCEVVLDRAEAIARVIGRAGPGDVVIVIGRGQRSLPLDDREEARRALRELRGAKAQKAPDR